jgi:hypothetical protein
VTLRGGGGRTRCREDGCITGADPRCGGGLCAFHCKKFCHCIAHQQKVELLGKELELVKAKKELLEAEEHSRLAPRRKIEP